MKESTIYRPEVPKQNPEKRIKIDKRGVLLTPEEMKEQRKNQDPRDQE